MGHFSIHVKGQRVGSVLKLEDQQLYACFNRRFPQYHDVWGTPDHVRNSLRQQCPGADYQPLHLPKVDAFLACADDKITPQQMDERCRLADIDGLQNI